MLVIVLLANGLLQNVQSIPSPAAG